MKKTTVYILVLVLSLSLLCACGDRNDNKTPAVTSTPSVGGMGTPDDGVVNDDDGIITDDDDNILDGDHDDADGEDDRNNGGAVGDIIDGDAPDMPEPNVGDDADANGGAGTASGNVTGNGSAGSRKARLR